MRTFASLALAAATVGLAASAANAAVMQLRMTTDNVSTADVYALTAAQMNRVNVRTDQLTTPGSGGDQAIAGTTLTGALIRSLVSFDLTGWAATVSPDGSPIQINSVTLALNINGATSTGTIHDVGIRMSTFGSFTSTTTWASLGGTATTDIVPSTSTLLGNTSVQINEKVNNIAVMKTFTFGSTSEFVDYFSSAANGSSKVLNLIFWNNSAVDGADLVRFATETGAGANGDPVTYSPVITVDYTVASAPIPEAASLGLLGLGALALIRRKR